MVVWRKAGQSSIMACARSMRDCQPDAKLEPFLFRLSAKLASRRLIARSPRYRPISVYEQGRPDGGSNFWFLPGHLRFHYYVFSGTFCAFIKILLGCKPAMRGEAVYRKNVHWMAVSAIKAQSQINTKAIGFTLRAGDI